MARTPYKQRRRIIAYVVCMWYQLVEEYVSMLMNNGRNTRSLAGTEDHVPRPLPYGREVYRSGFLLNATITTDVNCINMLRVKYRVFWKLVDLLKGLGGLKRTKNMEVDEMLAMFLVTMGHNIKNRTCQFLFRCSGETIFRTIRRVLISVLSLHVRLLAQPIPIPADSDNPTWKYFKDCVGALDGTYVNVRTNLASQARYRSRKGNAAINILAVCNPNTEFIYCLAGWEGSAHDSRVLRDALSRPGGLRVPEGTYYLCDAGYTNANGFLIPYRKQRYHLQEWGTNRPRTAKEFYSMKHSSARNCIERAFGVLKMRWALLRDTSWHSPKMVGMFFTAACLLHNFITRQPGGTYVFDRAYIPPEVVEPPIIDAAPGYVEPSEEWTEFRETLAEEMWASRDG
ncbi:Putative nuclease HARBI1 [Linum grandiflorum]